MSEGQLVRQIEIDDVDLGPHRARELKHQRETDAGTDGLTGQFIFTAVKQLENFLHLVRPDPVAVIAYRELQPSITQPAAG